MASLTRPGLAIIVALLFGAPAQAHLVNPHDDWRRLVQGNMAAEIVEPDLSEHGEVPERDLWGNSIYDYSR
ncbi:hypothetical protein [Marinobacterium arenosum]|uniref:hypothetical protein n=1 Tax=Marinobacterium arenosum TaxID=2862496 RepID=UPI001C970A1A|nr:hypothetical protein [Marinobacterium arenosum]MBY4675543.1 hypothetical protein [Marinobacterium arenosum]